jgi:outer membrane protein insertion porin family
MAWLARFLCSGCLIILISQSAWAGDSFTIQTIQINGLQRIERNTVLNYLPVHVGETLTPVQSQAVLHALYETGFF